MSILDDAIREHLELKRQHGAPADELKQLEDEAFGPPARPDDEADPFAEAPTEFMATAEAAAAPAADDAGQEPSGRRMPNIADLQEPPPPAPEPVEDKASPEEGSQIEPAVEEHPAMEHEAITELPPPPPEHDEPAGSHSTEERHAIAEQPTEMFDVETELDAASPPAAAGEAAPSDDELAEAELSEPLLAPAPPAEDSGDFDDDDDFFDEQRLSDELNQALEAPVEEATAPPTEEAEVPVELEEAGEDEPISEEYQTVEPAQEHQPVASEEEHEDVLEDTPDFLEESPEDDQLWFEQKPPKDFDFDD